MTRGKTIVTVVLVVVGGTMASKYIRPLGKVPGFSPNG